MFIIVSNLERLYKIFQANDEIFPIALRINKYDQLLFFTIGLCITSFGARGRPFPKPIHSRSSQSLRSLPAVLGVWDLIPIISQLLHRFRCHYCHQTYPFWYCLFEVWSGLLFWPVPMVFFSALTF